MISVLTFLMGLVLGACVSGLVYTKLMSKQAQSFNQERHTLFNDTAKHFHEEKVELEKKLQREIPIEAPGKDDDEILKVIEHTKEACAEDPESEGAKEQERLRGWLRELRWARKAIESLEALLRSAEKEKEDAYEYAAKYESQMYAAEERVEAFQARLEELDDQRRCQLEEEEEKRHMLAEAYQDHLSEIDGEFSDMESSLRVMMQEAGNVRSMISRRRA